MKSQKLTPKFEILGYADAQMAPIDFNKTPSKAIMKALKRAKLSLTDVDYFEINEVKDKINLWYILTF